MRIYHYKGWSFRQHSRGRWGMLRLSDAYQTWHRSLEGCRAFIRLHGNEPIELLERREA